MRANPFRDEVQKSEVQKKMAPTGGVPTIEVARTGCGYIEPAAPLSFYLSQPLNRSQGSTQGGRIRATTKPIALGFNAVASQHEVELNSRLQNSPEAGATFSSATCPAVGIARLFVEFAATHFLLDSSVLNELPKPFHCIRNFLPISKTKLDHNRSFRVS